MRLILLRHAKSDWNNPDLTDRERTLNDRGREAATAMGYWLREQSPLPDHALVSTATRARETFERLGLSIQTTYRDDLYLAEPEAILAALPSAGCVLLVGHNPGIAAAAEALAATPPAHPDFLRYPTAACTVLEFDAAPRWGTGRVVEFVVPRDL